MLNSTAGRRGRGYLGGFPMSLDELQRLARAIAGRVANAIEAAPGLAAAAEQFLPAERLIHLAGRFAAVLARIRWRGTGGFPPDIGLAHRRHLGRGAAESA